MYQWFTTLFEIDILYNTRNLVILSGSQKLKSFRLEFFIYLNPEKNSRVKPTLSLTHPLLRNSRQQEKASNFYIIYKEKENTNTKQQNPGFLLKLAKIEQIQGILTLHTSLFVHFKC